jgi:uncharacterized membrane protein
VTAPLALATLAPLLLAWRPFLDPLNLHEYWWAFLVPLALAVSFTYKAVRVREMRELPRATLLMTAQVILAMVMLGAAAFILLEFVLPRIIPQTF